MKLKLKASGDPAASSVPSTPVAETPPVQTPGAAGAAGKPRIKLKSSQPPTPVSESGPLAPPPLAAPLGPPTTKPKKPSVAKKAAADRRTTLSLTARRASIKQETDDDDLAGPTPTSSAGPKISLKRKLNQQPDRRDSANKGRLLLKNRKAPPPKRPVGVGYDSEASDAEDDPLIESQFVLRMQPGDDCEYLRDAIANKTLGAPKAEGGADVSMKFLDKESRRIMLTVRGTDYAAVLADLPCIVETMKSWDKRGWWKVADIAQMMLVLGPTESADAAKNYRLPKEVDPQTWAYAHGLTPPMHYVRKRRFRKRASYKTVEHIDEEVEQLLAADKEANEVTYKIVDDNEDAAAAPEDEYDYDDEPDSYLSTTENGYGQAYGEAQGQEDEEMDFGDLEADIMAELEMDGQQGAPKATLPTPIQPPLPIADAAANRGAVQTAIAEAINENSSTAPTPAAQDSEDESSDEDDDDADASSDEDEPTAIDADLVERERELEGQRQDIEELEKRIAQAKADIQSQKNILLKQRKMKTLKDLEEELAVKKRAMGLGDDDDE